MAKAQKDTVFMVSSVGTGYFYANRKNKKKTKGESKLSLKKYDPVARKHVLFEEKKLSKLAKKFVPGQEIVLKEAPKKSEQKSRDKGDKPEKSEKKGKTPKAQEAKSGE